MSFGSWITGLGRLLILAHDLLEVQLLIAVWPGTLLNGVDSVALIGWEYLRAWNIEDAAFVVERFVDGLKMGTPFTRLLRFPARSALRNESFGLAVSISGMFVL